VGFKYETTAALKRIRRLLVTTQEKLDAIATAVDGFATEIQTAVDGIAADIQAIKDANPAVDFANVEGKVARLQQATQSLKDLDAQHPPAPEPTPTP
jgi:uncharacterized membrane protein YccC